MRNNRLQAGTFRNQNASGSETDHSAYLDPALRTRPKRAEKGAVSRPFQAASEAYDPDQPADRQNLGSDGLTG